jgi:RNA polymerase sigma-70 factor (ECF subfamily)
VSTLVEQILLGDKAAFREIVQDHGPTIRTYLAGQLPDVDTVEDLAQETFLAAYESLDSFDLDGDMGSWLKGIARHRLLMHLRGLSLHGKVLQKLRAQILEAAVGGGCRRIESDGSDTLERLRECLGKLPEHVQRVVRARHFEKEKVASIACRLESSVDAISSLLFRGRKQLEACIEGRRWR